MGILPTTKPCSLCARRARHEDIPPRGNRRHIATPAKPSTSAEARRANTDEYSLLKVTKRLTLLAGSGIASQPLAELVAAHYAAADEGFTTTTSGLQYFDVRLTEPICPTT